MTIANLSGGRDSTAMVVKWLEMGNSLDKIIFCDTLYEFPQMYDYLNQLNAYLKAKFNKEITFLKPSCDILKKWAFEYPIQRGEYAGRLRGLPKALGLDYCTRELKANATRDFIKNLSNNKFKNDVLIGYTYNEVERGRISNLSYGVSVYPLHQWHFNEYECEEFLKKRAIANPLYKHFERTGCFLCPKQNTRSLKALFENYPNLWEKMKQMENKAQELNCVTQTFKANKSLIEYERLFKENPSFDFSDDYESEHICFCK